MDSRLRHSKLCARVLRSAERLDEVWRERWPQYELDAILAAIAERAIQKQPHPVSTIDLVLTKLVLDDLVEADDVVEMLTDVLNTDAEQLEWLAATLGRLMALQFDEGNARLAVEVYQRWRRVYKRLRQWYRGLDGTDLMVCLRFIRTAGDDTLPFLDYLAKTWFRPGNVIHRTEWPTIDAHIRSEALAAGLTVKDFWLQTLRAAIFKSYRSLPSHLPRLLAYVPVLRLVGDDVQRATLHGDTVKRLRRQCDDPELGRISVQRTVPLLADMQLEDNRSEADFWQAEVRATLQAVVPNGEELELLLDYYNTNNKRELAERYGISYDALRQRVKRAIQMARKNL